MGVNLKGSPRFPIVKTTTTKCVLSYEYFGKRQYRLLHLLEKFMGEKNS